MEIAGVPIKTGDFERKTRLGTTRVYIHVLLGASHARQQHLVSPAAPLALCGTYRKKVEYPGSTGMLRIKHKRVPAQVYVPSKCLSFKYDNVYNCAYGQPGNPTLGACAMTGRHARQPCKRSSVRRVLQLLKGLHAGG